jgi:predicted MPP superfamily phosphohydrolase
MNRRHFLRLAVYGSAAAAAVGGTCYGFFEAGWVRVDRQELALPRLPAGFRGTTVAFLTDIHHGPYVDQEYVASVVRTTNLLAPDLVILGGDYSLRDRRHIGPCFEVLAGLRAPLGVYGVLGNHDYWHGLRETRDGLASAKVTELTNAGVWLERGGERFRLAGVDDLWAGRPDLGAALSGATFADACLLVSHNPDFAETLRDRRVGLVLSGHTHGGQVVLPGCGSPWVPSRYGAKYQHGRVEAPATTVYVSAGLGTSGVPLRAGVRPEINLFTLV